tara:strand:- start:406 stop:1755 length:1350 start_codon:yes stop_codon:yes gene_type:complete
MSLTNLKLNKKILTGWGNYPQCDSILASPSTLEELKVLAKEKGIIARGNARSYGDSSISKRITIEMKNFNKIINFNKETGEITAEAGVILSELIYKYLPIGFFPYVTPGTKYVSLGGMIASNVHGKNHHIEGSLSDYVIWVDIIQSDGSILRCSKTDNSELFNWTLGGMGLTGIIFRACIKFKKVKSSWITSNKVVTKNLEDTIDVMENNLDVTYSVAWIDCISKGSSQGRSVVFLGEHSTKNDIDLSKRDLFDVKETKKITIPFFLPSFFMSYYLLKVFNFFYYNVNKYSKKMSIQSWDKYFYPLDNLKDWNKLYGKNGFYQFQCVIPIKESKKALKEILTTINASSLGSFLAVLKKFGQDNSNISFPLEGYTLALDFPRSKRVEHLLNELDKLVIKYNGRFYLTKDSRLLPSSFLMSDARVQKFKKFRNENQLKSHFESYQSDRLNI